MEFHCLAGPTNVSVDLNKMFFACESFCTVYPLELGEVTA